MARTKAKIGLGSQLKIGNGGSPETFAAITELKSHGFDAMNEVQDATNLDSDSGAAEYVGGILKYGPITGSGNFNADASQMGAYTDLAAGTVRNFQTALLSNTNKTISFAAIINKWAIKVPSPGGIMTVDFSLQVTGAVTIA